MCFILSDALTCYSLDLCCVDVGHVMVYFVSLCGGRKEGVGLMLMLHRSAFLLTL